ncbi:hypothetical protein JOE21_002614 [Desmospora profundinema]|uniref:Uncharacterized protein n=1 Tax=Desmospora profundinema TaxID=1571184 RepID=A0ABU1IP91_9BACL|nr:hypothetical protein [Desmospora profundinema]
MLLCSNPPCEDGRVSLSFALEKEGEIRYTEHTFLVNRMIGVAMRKAVMV